MIDEWFRDPQDGSVKTTQAVNIRDLHDHLMLEHGFRGSYRSLLRFVTATYPAPKFRPARPRTTTMPEVMYSQQWFPAPSMTATAPEFRTAKRSPAWPAAKSFPAVAP